MHKALVSGSARSLASRQKNAVSRRGLLAAATKFRTLNALIHRTFISVAGVSYQALRSNNSPAAPASMPLKPHQRSFVSEDGVSCEGTAFFCAGAGVPDSRDPGTSLHTTPSNPRRSSANLARSLGPTPRIFARSSLLSGRAVTISRSTASRTTRNGGTPISRATPARHAITALTRGSSSAACVASSSDARVAASREARARRMVPPSRAASAGPTPGTSASDAASAGG